MELGEEERGATGTVIYSGKEVRYALTPRGPEWL